MFRAKPLVLLAASLVLIAGGAWAQAQGGSRIRSRPLVVIDPGHGGKDPGAVSPVSGIAEKHVTLAVSRAIRDRDVDDYTLLEPVDARECAQADDVGLDPDLDLDEDD